MSFAKFSSDFLMETFTLVDNLFINEHLPYCDEKQIKVYLYGLYLCSNPANDNSIAELCARLDMTESEIVSAYGYFEDMGLVQIVSKQPLEVKYLSLKRSMQTPKNTRARSGMISTCICNSSSPSACSLPTNTTNTTCS